MSQLLNAPPGLLFVNKSSFHPSRTSTLTYQKCYAVHSSIQGGSHGIDRLENSFEYKARSCEEVESDTFPDIVYEEVQSEAFPHVQTLRKFPKEELHAKVVLVRFDSSSLLQAVVDQSAWLVSKTLFTIKYLLEAKAKVILVTSWTKKFHQECLGAESLAGILSSVLQHNVATVQCIDCDMLLKMEELQKSHIILLDNLAEYKEEVSNCPKFAELLSARVDIYVNEAFSESHKMLASTVGITRFCSASMAGYHFEESLCQLKMAVKWNQSPHVTIVGGGNLYDKAAAIHFLASRSDALVFVGMMSFQIMHALGLPVLPNLVEPGGHEAALDIIQLAHNRNIPILYPKDFWCTNNPFENQLRLFPAHGVMNGWLPIDLGPSSLEEIESLLAKCKKIMWIGPVKFKSSSTSRQTDGAIKLAQMIYKQCQRRCDVSVTIIGNMACKEMRVESTSASVLNLMDNASVVWDFLKGRKLPGVMALDIAYPFEIDWRSAFRDPAQPLVVDIGSGNGLFILGMAKKRKHLNFLGLEINEKLVKRCLESVHQSAIRNGYFIATNATSTFRSLVSSYPGELVLVSIQCPNPDFNKLEHRRRMLQQSLVEAVADLLTHDGKVFLQSDIETVALRMKEQFLKYGKGKLSVVCDYHDDKINRRIWLEENPFEVRSDWEQHVIDRGAPMYRLMLSKSNNVE